MNIILNNFHNNASKFKDIDKKMTKKSRIGQKIIIEQGLINEQRGFSFSFFKRADPKKCVQVWKKMPKC